MSRCRCQARSTGALLGSSADEPGVTEEHDQIGAGRVVGQRFLRRRAEP